MSQRLNCLGVTSLQLAWILPVLFALFLGIIDIGRFFFIRYRLNIAASEALDLALQGSGTDIDIRGLSPSDPKFKAFVAARDKVLDAAEKEALLAWVSRPESGGMADLLLAIHQDELITGYAHPLPSKPRGAVLLRPGEQAKIKTASSAWKEIFGAGALTSTSASNYDEVLRNNPTAVELRAHMKPILAPFFDLTVIGRASGYRRVITPSAVQEANQLAKEGVSTTTITTTTTTTRTTTSSMTTTTITCAMSWEERIVDCATWWKKCPDPVICENCIPCQGGL